jgi:polyhydroxyalkanoate synthase subunit PhaC
MSDQTKPNPDLSEHWLGLWSKLSSPIHSFVQSPVSLAFLQEVHETVQLAFNYWSRDESHYADLTGQFSRQVTELLSDQDLENADISTMQRQISELQEVLVSQLSTLIDDTEPLNERQKTLLRFSLRQLRAVIDPNNAFFGNPLMVASAVETQGELLLDASQNYLKDLSDSQFGLQIRRASEQGAKLGEDIATTPGEVVYQNDLMQLIHYQSSTPRQRKLPLLITPPCINRFYVFDLQPEQSMVRWLLDQGQDVYMISWVNPGSDLFAIGFEDYVRKGCLQAADIAAEISGTEQVNLIGYCIGGLIASIAAASKHGQERIASLSLFATLLDYSDPGELGVFTSPAMIEAIISQAIEEGVLSADMLSTAFTFLREEQLFWRFFRRRYLCGEEAKPDALMYWGQDATQLPAKMATEYLQNFYGSNQLAAVAGYLLGEERIYLKSSGCPKYVLAGKQDHIVPFQSALDSISLLGGEIRMVQSSGGHVRGVFNHPDRGTGQYKAIGDSDLATGSWWQDWYPWLEQLSGSWVKGKICAPAQYPGIETAPGSYVRIRP